MIYSRLLFPICHNVIATLILSTVYVTKVKVSLKYETFFFIMTYFFMYFLNL